MVLVALVATGLTGGLSPLGIEGLPDPGILTRVGLPTVQVIRDLAAMATVGVLVLAATCVPPQTGDREASTGSGASDGWWRGRSCRPPCGQWPSLTLIAFVYSDASGSAIGGPGFVSEAVFFAFEFELGQYGLWGAALADAGRRGVRPRHPHRRRGHGRWCWLSRLSGRWR